MALTAAVGEGGLHIPFANEEGETLENPSQKTGERGGGLRLSRARVCGLTLESKTEAYAQRGGNVSQSPGEAMSESRQTEVQSQGCHLATRGPFEARRMRIKALDRKQWPGQGIRMC